MDPQVIEDLENDPLNWQEASADNGLKFFFNFKVSILNFTKEHPNNFFKVPEHPSNFSPRLISLHGQNLIV